jgi:RND family efflux transporter MFP subunit
VDQLNNPPFLPLQGQEMVTSRAAMLNKIPDSVARILCVCVLACAGGAYARDQAPGFDCVVTPSESVDLGSPVPGQLHEVLVDRSDPVHKGQVVAKLDSRLERANLEIARFRAETDTEVHLRDAALAIDQRTARRVKSLVSAKVASAQERDRALRDARLSSWRARQARDDLELHALELARAESILDRRRIRSPIDGVVVARLRNSGEYIDDQALLRIVRLDPLHVEAILPMRLFGQINPGMRASVVPELSQDQAYEATVVLVDPMGDAGSGTFGVRLALPNPNNAIPAGLKCRVQVSTDQPLLSATESANADNPRLAATTRVR